MHTDLFTAGTPRAPNWASLPIPPERLPTYRLLMLATALGRVDIIRPVRPVGEYADLETVEMKLVAHGGFEVLALDRLNAVVGALSRPHDRTVEVEVRAIRDVLRDSTQSGGRPTGRERCGCRRLRTR
jgi:hypothetical protein